MADQKNKTVTLPLGDTIPGPVTIQAMLSSSASQASSPFIISEQVNDGIGAGTAQDIPSSSSTPEQDDNSK